MKIAWVEYKNQKYINIRELWTFIKVQSELDETKVISMLVKHLEDALDEDLND